MLLSSDGSLLTNDDGRIPEPIHRSFEIFIDLVRFVSSYASYNIITLYCNTIGHWNIPKVRVAIVVGCFKWLGSNVGSSTMANANGIPL